MQNNLPLGYRHISNSISDSTAPNPLPASFLRGGTSKGIFLNKSDLPADNSQWDRIFLGIMGSPDPEYGRQLNGMGGGISSLSKICVVGAPTPSQKERGIDVEYTFIQVGIRDSSIDYSGNCGNLSSMIGVFAVDQGISTPRVSGTHATVRSFNTNTLKVVDTTFPVSSSSDSPVPLLENPETSIAGVPGKASTILLEFIDPAGARTGTLLPSGTPLNHLTILPSHGGDKRIVRCSCVDATNPTVFVSYSDLIEFLPIAEYIEGSAPIVGETLENIRSAAAVKMGLDPAAQAQPKIAILRAPYTEEDRSQQVDIVIHALSMGVLHKAVPMTVGLCAGVAANIRDSIAWESCQQSSKNKAGMVRLRHPGGIVDVGAAFAQDGEVKSAKVVRTGRRLMSGAVWW
ncbi:hypothetical protein H0H87_002270 [Tephrocybe sp. NHM501043]|nr:hypothetical protein H0H87_002270 [Tephrocybe sp. NHM501043]